MTKPVRIRPLADTEIDALADYIARDNPHAALRFLEATQQLLIAFANNLGLVRGGMPTYRC